MTAREFLEYMNLDLEVNRKNLAALTHYISGNVDYVQFPDADVVTQDGIPIMECADEPAAFEEWYELYGPPAKEKWLKEAEKKFSWGGRREGAGRPSTGRKKRNFYITDEEYEKMKEYLELLRKTNKAPE